MADQVVLKHIREAVHQSPLHQLEIELRLNRQLTRATFDALEDRLATATWDAVRDTRTTDETVGDVRVTDGTVAVRKRRVAMTDAGDFRVVTSQELTVPMPKSVGTGFSRVKQRRERDFWGWKLSLTVVNPDDAHPSFEVEVELDPFYLVRRPPERLAEAGARLMEDVVGMLT